MAAEVESMAYVGAVPWHGLGRALPEHVTWAEMLTAAGLDWRVGLAPLFTNGASEPVTVEGFQAVRRSTDGAVLGVVSDRYAPIQNAEAFSTFEDVLGAHAKLETAGSLRGGKIVWGLATLADTEILGERHARFMLLTTRHDGGGSLLGAPCITRVVCCNTLNVALGEIREGGVSLNVRHTGDVEQKRLASAAVLAESFGLVDRYAALADRLAALKLTRPDMAEIMLGLIPAENPEAEERRGRILAIEDHTADQAQWQGTGYGLLQAVLRYTDHESGTARGAGTADRKMAYALMGAGASLKSRTLKTLAALAA